MGVGSDSYLRKIGCLTGSGTNGLVGVLVRDNVVLYPAVMLSLLFSKSDVEFSASSLIIFFFISYLYFINF